MDEVKFDFLVKKILVCEDFVKSIGQQKEKNIHRLLKHYISSDIYTHEIKIGRYIADVFKNDHIYEIQTKQFFTLKKKLEAFLSEHNVTIVYPVIRQKTIMKLDKNTGEVISQKKSPKKNKPYNIFDELYGIKSYLTFDNLSFKIILLDATEIIFNQDKNIRRKKEVYNIIPTKIIDEIDINSCNKLINLVDFKQTDNISTKAIKMVLKIDDNLAFKIINVLMTVGLLSKTGKQGNLLLYKIK